MPRFAPKVAVLMAVFTCLVLPVACTPRPATPPAATVETPRLRVMPFEAKRSHLPTGFPIEVPVPDGQLGKVSRQGSTVWVYEITLGATPEQAAAWYEQAYAGANWTETKRSATGASTRLLFQKGTAQTDVGIEAAARGAHATVAVGIGVPVGQTY